MSSLRHQLTRSESPYRRCLKKVILFLILSSIIGLCTHRLVKVWITDNSTGAYGIGLRTTDKMNLEKVNATKSHEIMNKGNKKLTGKELFKSIPKPILVMGMPKAGTTSIFEYFKCGNAKVSHWRCYPNHKEKLCGALIRDNISSNKPPLQNTGDYEVYAQLDGDTYYPQMVALDEIHENYPNATFILNQRNVTAWINSIKHFTPGKGAYIEEYGAPKQSLKAKSEEELRVMYRQQNERIYEFMGKYPSHILVEVSIEDVNAGTIMENAFGISEKCWGHANENMALKYDQTTP